MNILKDSHKTFYLIGIGSIFFLICGILMTPKLWFLNSTFPKFPIFLDQSISNPVLNFILLIASLLIYSASLYYKKNWLILLYIFMWLFLIINDQMMLQPWVYIFNVIAVLSALEIIREKDGKSNLNSIQLFVICIYFFAGFFKIDPTFFKYAGATFFDFLIPILPAKYFSYIVLLGYCIPFFEILIAFGLLTKKYRKLALRVAIAMHLFIIFFVVLRLKWNFVIIPWNIGMIWLVFHSFQKSNISISNILKPTTKTHIAIIFLGLLLPFSHTFGIWDSYLSFNLYSYNTPNVVIDFSKEDELTFEKRYNQTVEHYSRDSIFSMNDWAMKELGVPLYPEKRILKKLIKDMCAQDILTNSTLYFGKIHFEKENGLVIDCNTIDRF